MHVAVRLTRRNVNSMAATLKHLTQRTLSLYIFADVDHPLIVAYSDYVYARLNALPCQAEKARLKAELRLETMTQEVLDHAA